MINNSLLLSPFPFCGCFCWNFPVTVTLTEVLLHQITHSFWNSLQSWALRPLQSQYWRDCEHCQKGLHTFNQGLRVKLKGRLWPSHQCCLTAFWTWVSGLNSIFFLLISAQHVLVPQTYAQWKLTHFTKTTRPPRKFSAHRQLPQNKGRDALYHSPFLEKKPAEELLNN